jgi:DNA-binding phage protein
VWSASLGTAIRVAPAERKLKVVQLIDATPMSRATAYRSVAGTRNPDFEEIVVIARFLGVRPSDLIAAAERVIEDGLPAQG